MAINESVVWNLEESMEELLDASNYCVNYVKSGPPYDIQRTGGCLGYPGAILLFSLIDSIGSYFRKNKDIKIIIDGKQTTIDHSGWEHFKILNSKYFNLNLTQTDLKMLYNQYRSPLTHNATLASGVIMYPSTENTIVDNVPFAILRYEDGMEIPIVFLKELYITCREAVDMFKLEMDKIVPYSNQFKDMSKK